MCKLVDSLQVLRIEIEAPIHINSRYRTPEYNALYWWRTNSFHKTAIHVKHNKGHDT